MLIQTIKAEVVDMALDERKRRILQAIVQDYITSAEPVGSRTIARKYDFGVGAATIRNEMFDLEIQGYLKQPHASAGRIPSVKGYRFYVDCLLEPKTILPEEQKMVEDWIRSRMNGMDQIFSSTAKVLAEITHNAIFVMAAQQEQARLKYIRFLPLDERRAIMLVVTDSGHVENCLYAKPEKVSLDDLNRLAVHLTRYLAGKTMSEIDLPTLENIRDVVIDDPALYRNAFASLEQALKKNHRVYKEGTLELFDKPEFRDVHKAKNLLVSLEEQDVVNHLFVGKSEDSGMVTVRIGEEVKLPPIQECSVIEATFTAGNDVIGKIAVLGPTRMEYARIIGLLNFMKEHMKQILIQYEQEK